MSEPVTFNWVLEVIGLSVILGMILLCYCRYRCSKKCGPGTNSRTSSFNSGVATPETRRAWSISGGMSPPARGSRDLPPSYDAVVSSVDGRPRNSFGVYNNSYVNDEAYDEPPPPYNYDPPSVPTLDSNSHISVPTSSVETSSVPRSQISQPALPSALHVLHTPRSVTQQVSDSPSSAITPTVDNDSFQPTSQISQPTFGTVSSFSSTSSPRTQVPETSSVFNDSTSETSTPISQLPGSLGDTSHDFMTTPRSDCSINSHQCDGSLNSQQNENMTPQILLYFPYSPTDLQ